MPGIFVPRSTPVTEPFWEGTALHELRMQRCMTCQRFYFYPRSFCPRCWSREVQWRTLSGRATLASYVIARLPAAEAYEEVPYVIALVEVEEGPRMMSNVVGVEPDEASLPLGLALEVAFEQREDVSVPVFRPCR